ncbi:MAG: glycosyltransferase family 2 protein [Acidobacteriota bacterium]
MTAPAVSVIVVNHRSAVEAGECVRSLRDAFQAEGMRGEIVLVDCDSGADEVRALEALPADTRVFLPENRGYSGGVNAGLQRARSARLLLANADVVFLPGALPALLSEIEDASVGAAAPLCVWDAEGRLRMPADSATGFFGELAGLRAGRSPGRDGRRFARFAMRTLRLWEEGGDAGHLVGAVIAARRDVFDRVGPFDERFLFEYEETEWEDRVRRAGLRLRFTPRARVRHLFARSASRNPDTQRRRTASRRLYRQMRYGRLGRAILERAGNRPAPAIATAISEPAIAARPGSWLALSTNASVIPFAGTPLDRDFRLDPEVARSLPPGFVYLRTFRASDGQPLETAVWEKPA